jgi:hemerythrin superfamily protein
MEESIIGRLHLDHQKIYPLLMEIENSPTIAERKTKFTYLKTLIVPLLKAEDETIFQKLIDIPEKSAQSIGRNCLHEHHDLRDYIQTLNLLNVSAKKWIKVYRDFRKLAQKHCQAEEDLLFPEIKEDFSREELVEIGFAFEEAKTLKSTGT